LASAKYITLALFALFMLPTYWGEWVHTIITPHRDSEDQNWLRRFALWCRSYSYIIYPRCSWLQWSIYYHYHYHCHHYYLLVNPTKYYSSW